MWIYNDSSTLAYLPVLGEDEAILTGVDFPMPLIIKDESANRKTGFRNTSI